eukprot:Selendium_serpulae@DN5978_c0_g2_i1.p1
MVESSELLRSFTDTRSRHESRQFGEDSQSKAVCDGSKLIFRLGKNSRLSLDKPLNILFSTAKLSVESRSLDVKTIISGESNSVVVLDSGRQGRRFFPISLNHYGTVYTKPGVAHIVLGCHRRNKVSAQSLPYSQSNKFEAAGGSQHEDVCDESELHGETDTADGLLYLQATESLVRYRLCKGERIDLYSGELAAWSLGVAFEFKNSFWWGREVTAVSGEGTVWIEAAAAKNALSTQNLRERFWDYNLLVLVVAFVVVVTNVFLMETWAMFR